MSRDLGIQGASAPPSATRVARPGWRDPRLWIGVLLVAASVVLGSRLMAAADDSVAVWSMVEEQGAGTPVGEAEVTAARVRFTDSADLDLYFPATEPLPNGLVLRRGVGAGELLARTAVGPAEDLGLHQVSIEVAPHQMPRTIETGAVVDVYLDDAAHRTDPDGDPRPALDDVTVIEAPSVEETFAAGGTRQVVVAVDADLVEGFFALLGSLDDPVVRVSLAP